MGLTLKILFIIRSLKATFDERDFVRFCFFDQAEENRLKSKKQKSNALDFDSVLPARQPAVAPAERAHERKRTICMRSVHISAPLAGGNQFINPV